MDRIGLRELRQHASRYVGRVASGESIEIAVRGRLVARLIPASDSGWDDLVQRGDVIPATSPHGLLDEPAGDYGVAGSAALEQLRREER